VAEAVPGLSEAATADVPRWRGLTERLLLAVEDEEATLWLLAALRCKNAAVADVDEEDEEPVRSFALLACRFAARSAWKRFKRFAVVPALVDMGSEDAPAVACALDCWPCALIEGFGVELVAPPPAPPLVAAAAADLAVPVGVDFGAAP